MRKLLLLLPFLFCSPWVMAQSSYTISAIPYNPDPFAGGTPTGIVLDDVWGDTVQLPFNFCFYGQTYDKLQIGSNGIVSFDLVTPGSFCTFTTSVPLPNNTLPTNAIYGAFQDLFPVVGGSINYSVRGIAPYRRFIVSYYHVPMFSCNTITFTQQIILYETTNVIEAMIENKQLCPFNNGMAIEGLSIDSTTAYVVPGRNYPTAWTAVNDGYRFTPVGPCSGPASPDVVSGKVFADVNGNCVQDVGEFGIMNRGVIANGGTFYGWTDTNGDYSISMTPGSYAINEYLVGPYLASNCAPGGVQNVILSGSAVAGVDFADSAIAYCSDLSVGIGTGMLRRCLSTFWTVTYCNNGSYPDSNAVVTVTLIDSVGLDSASAPYTTTGPNTYAFNVGILMPGQCGTIILHTSTGCDSVGTIYCVSATISGSYPVDCNTYNNTDTDCHPIMGPFDPNAKLVAAQDFTHRGYVETDVIDDNDALTYMILFQNVGNASALDVVVRDMLDPALDPQSVEALAGSAPFTTIVLGNEVVFRFDNINLPDSASNEPGSHGFVKFRVQQKVGNAYGTVITNQAGIYFDYEAPVITNQTFNTIPLLDHTSTALRNVADVYPNPGREQLVVRRLVDSNVEFLLYDLAGKVVRRAQLTDLQTSISTSDLQSGLYLYRLVGDGQLLDAGKWVKQ